METLRITQGDVILVPFPFSDRTGQKVRPAIVISNDGFNRGDDIVIAAVTSNTTPGTYTVLIDNNSLQEGVLHSQSAVKAGRLATIDKHIAIKRIATITPVALQNVVAAVKRVLGQ